MSDRIKQRIWACGEWRALSAIHLGGEPTGETDMSLLRASDGSFYIPAGSIAGAARHALAARYMGYERYRNRNEKEELAIRRLFGGGELDVKDEAALASLLTVYDAPAVGDPSATVRDGVRIELITGQASEGAKFTLEVLPAGTRFRMRFLLTLYAQTPGKKLKGEPPVPDQKLRGLFRAMLESFSESGIRLGARTRRGYGQGEVKEWTIRLLDMENRDHVLAWLARRPEDGDPLTLDELGTAELSSDVPYFEIDASLRLRTSLLVRKAGETAADPDMVHLTEAGNSLLPGTGLAGAIRHRVERIGSTLGLNNREAILASMFGPLHEQGNDRALRGGRVWVSECALEPGERLVQGRVAIDRFTGGALEAALFDEAPFWPQGDGPHARVRIRLEAPRSDAEKGLLLAAFKDLWLGDLPLGGETGVGRGVFEGVHATIVDSSGSRWKIEATAGDPRRVRVEGNPKGLDEYLSTLPTKAHEWEPPAWEKEEKHASR